MARGTDQPLSAFGPPTARPGRAPHPYAVLLPRHGMLPVQGADRHIPDSRKWTQIVPQHGLPNPRGPSSDAATDPPLRVSLFRPAPTLRQALKWAGAVRHLTRTKARSPCPPAAISRSGRLGGSRSPPLRRKCLLAQSPTDGHMPARPAHEPASLRLRPDDRFVPQHGLPNPRSPSSDAATGPPPRLPLFRPTPTLRRTLKRTGATRHSTMPPQRHFPVRPSESCPPPLSGHSGRCPRPPRTATRPQGPVAQARAKPTRFGEEAPLSPPIPLPRPGTGPRRSVARTCTLPGSGRTGRNGAPHGEANPVARPQTARRGDAPMTLAPTAPPSLPVTDPTGLRGSPERIGPRWRSPVIRCSGPPAPPVPPGRTHPPPTSRRPAPPCGRSGPGHRPIPQPRTGRGRASPGTDAHPRPPSPRPRGSATPDPIGVRRPARSLPLQDGLPRDVTPKGPHRALPDPRRSHAGTAGSRSVAPLSPPAQRLPCGAVTTCREAQGHVPHRRNTDVIPT